MNIPLACIILAAGKGKRMQSDLPKPLHNLAGRPMIGWLLETVKNLGAEKTVIVTGRDDAPWQAFLKEQGSLKTGSSDFILAVQDPPRGTGDAVAAALPSLKNYRGNVLILLADMPLLSKDTLLGLIAAKQDGLSVLGAKLHNPAGFGRMILNPQGGLARIVEDKDASGDVREITLCNMGAFCVDADQLRDWVSRIGNDNAQGEFYITDLPEIAAADGAVTNVFVTSEEGEVKGANSREELSALEAHVQQVLRKKAMDGGATLIDPSSVFFSFDTKIGRDVTIEPNIFFGPGVIVEDRVTIHAYSHIAGAIIEEGASIGPFARLRPETVIGHGSKIGNFVEVKKSILGPGVKAGHLAYIGDAEVGAGVNYSCGAITANYDGFKKSKTIIGEGAMIGSNVNLVAPVTIGAGAYIGAGSTITKDVESDALAVARERPSIIPGWALKKRAKKA